MKQFVIVASRIQAQVILYTGATVILVRFSAVLIHSQTLVQLTVTKPSQDSSLQGLKKFALEL